MESRARDPEDPSQLRTLAYRTAIGGGDELRFVAEKRPRPGELRGESTVSVVLSDDTIEVDNRLRYRALYQPVTTLRLWAPAGVNLAQSY